MSTYHENLPPAEADQLRSMFLALADECQHGSDLSTADRQEILEQLLGTDVCRRLGVYRLPEGFRLSVVIPVYNEAATIERVIDRVRGTHLPCEMILVDDCSRDGTREVLERLARDHADLRVLFHEANRGKGAALRTGFQHATGDVVVIQDADMEYDPQDFRLLLQPIVEGRADVVFGSRFLATERAVSPYWHQAANQLITSLSNLRLGRKFSDVETCYKMFRRELIQQIAPTLRENRFGIEIELTAKLTRAKDARIFERPIRYDRRSYAEGKKIGWRDGLWALWCILRY